MLQKTQEVLEFIANDELFENNDIRLVVELHLVI
jgi:hypothetical protein